MNVDYWAFAQLAMLCAMILCAFGAGVCTVKWWESR